MVARIEMISADKPDLGILKQAAELIRQGRVLVCPTDTGYAFSVNALDRIAVAEVFDLKGRAYSNPIHVAVSSIVAAGKYARLNKIAEYLASYFLPGALTMVLPRKKIIPDLLVAGRDTIGIRIPDNKVILTLASITNLPLTATSANISGTPTPYRAEEVIEQLGKAIDSVALVLDQGTLHPPELSTIIDLTVAPPQLLRQGLIKWEDILKALKLLQESTK